MTASAHSIPRDIVGPRAAQGVCTSIVSVFSRSNVPKPADPIAPHVTEDQATAIIAGGPIFMEMPSKPGVGRQCRATQSFATVSKRSRKHIRCLGAGKTARNPQSYTTEYTVTTKGAISVPNFAGETVQPGDFIVACPPPTDTNEYKTYFEKLKRWGENAPAIVPGCFKRLDQFTFTDTFEEVKNVISSGEYANPAWVHPKNGFVDSMMPEECVAAHVRHHTLSSAFSIIAYLTMQGYLAPLVPADVNTIRKTIKDLADNHNKVVNDSNVFEGLIRLARLFGLHEYRAGKDEPDDETASYQFMTHALTWAMDPSSAHLDKNTKLNVILQKAQTTHVAANDAGFKDLVKAIDDSTRDSFLHMTAAVGDLVLEKQKEIVGRATASSYPASKFIEMNLNMS